tara:strand:+ start:547 stop:1044 length:498 start_codon:yes stop_codon:yes gene_type:complete
MSVISSRPIPERIAAEIESRVAALQTGIKPNTHLVDVLRPKRIDTFTPQHMLAVISSQDPEYNEEISCEGNPPANGYDQRFEIAVYLMPSEKDPTPIETFANTVAADVCESLTDSGQGWHSMGGLCIDTRILSYEYMDASGGVDGIIIPLVVTYRVSERSWYESR